MEPWDGKPDLRAVPVILLLLAVVVDEVLVDDVFGFSGPDQPPQVTILSPLEGEWHEGFVTIEIEASGISKDTDVVVTSPNNAWDIKRNGLQSEQFQIIKPGGLSHSPHDWTLAVLIDGVVTDEVTITGLFPRQLTNNAAEDVQPEWNSAGDTLVFKSSRGLESGMFEVYSINLDRWASSNLIETELEYHGYPAWSHDGTHIVFNSWVDTADGGRQMEIFTANVETGETYRVTDDPAFDDSGRWSPDGSEIIFYSNRDGTMDLWKVPVGATGEPLGEPELVVGTPAREHCGRWSYDGESIIYESDEGGDNDLWLIPSEGGEPQQITFDDYEDGYPGWAPDGEHVVYNSLRDDNGDLWIVSLEDRSMRRLTSDPAWDAHPTWSADGRYIAFHSDRAGNMDIWVVEIPDLASS